MSANLGLAHALNHLWNTLTILFCKGLGKKRRAQASFYLFNFIQLKADSMTIMTVQFFNMRVCILHAVFILVIGICITWVEYCFSLRYFTFINECTDYGHTIAKSLILFGPNSNPNPI